MAAAGCLSGCFKTDSASPAPVSPPERNSGEAQLTLASLSDAYRDRMALAAPKSPATLPGDAFTTDESPDTAWKEVVTDSSISMLFIPPGGSGSFPRPGGAAGSDSPIITYSDVAVRTSTSDYSVKDEVLVLSGDPAYPPSTLPVTPPGPVSGTGIAPQAGLMTAGEWYDHRHWADYQEYLRKYPGYFQAWGMDLQRRVRIGFVDKAGTPLPDADVELEEGGETVFRGRTYADGTIAFFPSAAQENGDLSARVEAGGKLYTVQVSPARDDDQVWNVAVPARCEAPRPAMDLAFIVDVTGSMGDELGFLQQELLDITAKAFRGIDADLRIGLVFYRDRGDAFVTRVFPFTHDAARVTGWLKGMAAGGGGDMPESVNRAFRDAFHKLTWSDRGAVRLAFLIGDAPPHYYPDEKYTYVDAAAEAVRRGIKIMPVAASGADRSTEYLFRMLAVQTEGKYIFITDDSGIGNGHLEAEVGKHDVESLNAILARTIRDELASWPGVTATP